MLMHLLYDSESTLQKSTKMHEALFRTARTDLNNDNEDISAWAKLLTREGGENGDDGMYPKIK